MSRFHRATPVRTLGRRVVAVRFSAQADLVAA